jgi:hypothetical protein
MRPAIGTRRGVGTRKLMERADQPFPVEALGKNGDLFLFRDRRGRERALTTIASQVGTRRFELAGGITVELFSPAVIRDMYGPGLPRHFDVHVERKRLMRACCNAGLYVPWRGWTD